MPSAGDMAAAARDFYLHGEASSAPAPAPPQQKHLGVRACHCCGKPIFNRERALRCSNSRETLTNGRPVCTKDVCRDCFDEDGWSWGEAQADVGWTCPHCRDVCPRCVVADPFASGDGLGQANVGLRGQLQNAQRASQFWALIKEIERAQVVDDDGAAPAAAARPAAASTSDAPWPEVCSPSGSAAAPTGEEEGRIGGWGSPNTTGDAWGHAAGAGAVLAVRSGEGGAPLWWPIRPISPSWRRRRQLRRGRRQLLPT